MELLEKLAAIIPRPRKNLVIYHGVLGARAKLRPKVVAYKRPVKPAVEKIEPAQSDEPSTEEPTDDAEPKPRHYTWAELMRRTFDLDVLQCPKCGGRLKLIAMIEQPEVIEKILRHLKLPTEPPRPRPARAPPEPEQLELYTDL